MGLPEELEAALAERHMVGYLHPFALLNCLVLCFTCWWPYTVATRAIILTAARRIHVLRGYLPIVLYLTAVAILFCLYHTVLVVGALTPVSC